MAAKKAQQATTASKKAFPAWVFPLFLILAFALVYPYIFDKKVNLGGDNAGYFILGKAISSGAGYSDIHVPGSPAHNHFPPGYPAIMALVMFFTQSIMTLKVLNGLFFLGTLFILFRLFERITGNQVLSFSVSFLVLLNMHLLSYSTIMMSEIPFVFFSALAVLLFMNSQDSKLLFYKNYNFYLLILISSFAFHIRTAGIALVAGLALFMLINRNFKQLLAYLAGFAVLGIPWFLRGQSLGGSSYLTQLFLKNPYRPEDGSMELADWFSRFGNNVVRYLGKEIPSSVFPGIPVGYGDDGESNIYAGILILGIAIFGLIRLPKYRWLMIGYLAGSFAILLLWPEVWFGVRFILPLIPFLLFLVIFGLYDFINILLRKISLKPINPLIFLFLAVFFIPQLKQLNEAAKSPYDKKFKTYFELAAWANKNLPEDAVIITRKPGLFYLFANRLVADFKSTPDYNEFFDDFTQKGATHVVLDQLGYSQTGRYLLPAIQDNAERFDLTHQIPDPDTYLFSYSGNYGYNGEWAIEEKDGQFIHTKQGEGTMTYRDGSVYTGTWKNNLPNGKGTKTLPGGESATGIWENGNLISQ